MTYSTAMRTVVDIDGNLPFFATLSVTRHEARAFGALSLVPTMKHGPDSLHVLLPVYNDDTRRDNRVREFFLTVELFTVNPGRAASSNAVEATWPVAVRVVIANV